MLCYANLGKKKVSISYLVKPKVHLLHPLLPLHCPSHIQASSHFIAPRAASLYGLKHYNSYFVNFWEFSGSPERSKQPNDEKENTKHIFTVFKCLYPGGGYIHIRHKFVTQTRRAFEIEILSMSVNKFCCSAVYSSACDKECLINDMNK